MTGLLFFLPIRAVTADPPPAYISSWRRQSAILEGRRTVDIPCQLRDSSFLHAFARLLPGLLDEGGQQTIDNRQEEGESNGLRRAVPKAYFHSLLHSLACDLRLLVHERCLLLR